MKKRILFVDDEVMILQGLQRMLRPMREEWEMEFIDSGAKALERMRPAPFDVVVSDMRMPGMNGAEFLTAVMKRHPKTIRLILSGHADKELILQCVGATHQYLAKPCDADALKATVLRASNLESNLQSESLRKLVGQLSHLPSIPSLYMEIVEIANHPGASLDDVAQVIARDLAMTARILRLVNSAYFGLRRELSSTEEALAYIGLDLVKSLVLSVHSFSQFERATSGNLQMKSLWEHSLKVAAAAKRIAQLELADRKMVCDAFTAGILHDVGKLVLAANLPDEYARATRLAETEQIESYVAEEQIFGANHADVGGYLLGLWGLPVPVVEAIALHHRPSGVSNPAFSPLTMVHVADACARESALGTMSEPRWDQAYLSALDLTDRVTVWRESIQMSEPAAFCQ